MLKQVYAPHLGRPVKFGRKPSAAAAVIQCAAPILRLSALGVTLPTPPDTLDLTPNALPSLRNILKNGDLGDCVIAGGYHQLGVATGNSGNGIFVPTDAQVVNDYHYIGGYNGTPATDNGCDLITAAQFWSQTGFANGSKVLGVLAVDARNPLEIMQGLYLFDSAVFGIGLPDAYINPFPAADNFVWGVNGRADQNNGHCFVGVGYDKAKGVKIDTWALLGWFTFDAIAAYASAASQGELYIFLTQDMINKASGKSPTCNATIQDICTYFNAMGGHVVVPPGPTPPTPPAPPGPGAGHAVTFSIDGAVRNFTYWSKTNPRRPKGTSILYKLGNVTQLDGVVVDASHR